ncbi:MAG TPA: thioredoxin family protein [Gemmatimonadaceae bacterium]|nr:thioredoxin family protein [Gemmatimonadaceae bacterium]
MITKARYCDGETFAEFIARPIKNHELWMGVYKHVVIPIDMSARVEALHGKWHLLVLSEDWCGDAVNIVPVIAKLTESVSNMDMRILARDENLDIMDTHLTGESRSIPIIILLDRKYQECGWWGPRPRELQNWVMEQGLSLPKDEKYKQVRTFYARDRGLSTMGEIVSMLEHCCARGPIPAHEEGAHIV